MVNKISAEEFYDNLKVIDISRKKGGREVGCNVPTEQEVGGKD